MDPVETATKACPYCSSEALTLRYPAEYHPYLKDHGPWDMHLCNGCGSLITFPIPSPEKLTRLYDSFKGGMIPEIRDIRDEYPLNAWFRQCLGHALRYAGRTARADQHFRWSDLGAGAGEVSLLLSRSFPHARGKAVDLTPRPKTLTGAENVLWLQEGLEKTDVEIKPGEIDLALSITVIEHLAHPDRDLRKWISSLAEGGCLYLTTPRADCMAFRLLGRRWPYLIPGEHLHVPSRKGMRILLERLCKEMFGEDKVEIQVRSVVLPYPLGYFLRYFKLAGRRMGKVASIPIRIPTGLLEASVRRK